MRRTEVKINGEYYLLRGELEGELMHQIADYVDQKMDQVRQANPVVTTSKVAILAALNIAEELFLLKIQKQEEAIMLAERSSRLISLLDENIPGERVSEE